jgi:ribokinase
VRFIGRVGGDVFGDEIVSLLDNEGISRTGLRRGHGATGTAHITVDGDGQNSIIVVSAANLAVSADQLTPDSMAGLGWLVTQLELPLQTVHQALRRARTAGIRTVLTPAPAMSVDNDVLKLVDLLVPNQFEASILSGLHDPRDAAAQLSRICGDVVVTLGEAGAVWARQGRIVASIPAQPVPVVDTTGAGDTFVGVLVAELAEGSEMPSALRLASVAASLSVGRNGATASMPSRAEIHHFA